MVAVCSVEDCCRCPIVGAICRGFFPCRELVFPGWGWQIRDGGVVGRSEMWLGVFLESILGCFHEARNWRGKKGGRNAERGGKRQMSGVMCRRGSPPLHRFTPPFFFFID
ncbi:hypothetical protein V6N12_023037 [Hibiscus sabdariffa]|uniref:Uncharacterized protein n=1 Tax=Hibiscus sabdariffa TaxID=183260 RepID=A0ABR2FWI5_9ROSI